MSLYDHLAPEERAAVSKVRQELFPQYSHDAVARKLIRDALVGMGMLALPSANRSRGARQRDRPAAESHSSV